MNQYDHIFNSEKTSQEGFSPEEGVAAIAVITVISNSEVSNVNTDYLIDLLWETELFDDYSEEEMVEMVETLRRRADQEGLGAIFNAAYDCLPDELLPDAFAAGVMMLIDESGNIPLKLRGFLKEFQQVLEIEDEEAQAIIDEVVTILNETEEDEYGEEEDELNESNLAIYQSPAGNFSVPIPVQSEKGGSIEEQEGVVGFSDDFGRLLRIDYYPVSAEEADKMESLGEEDYLNFFLVDSYVDQAIFANIPNSKIEYREYLKDAMDGSYFVVVNMPHGSTLSVQKNPEASVRLNALRGLIAFPVDDFLYVVSCQRTFLEGETPAPIEQEVEGLKTQLLNFIDTVEFT